VWTTGARRGVPVAVVGERSDGEVQAPARPDAQNRNQQGTWATSGNDTTIRCREVSNGATLRSGRAMGVRITREKGSLGRKRGRSISNL
jgi:hypothetical protein